MLRSFLLAPCLLICLACATPTPFPVENLKVGMTTKEVRQSVGEPRFNHLGKVWIYTHERENWDWLFFPTVISGDVFLHFHEEKLIQWQVTEPVVSSGYNPNSALDKLQRQQNQWFRDQQGIKDYQHHKKEHTHHHDDNC